MSVYYKTTKGAIIRDCDLEQAFLIVTGSYRYKSEKNYLLWLKSVWGNYIISAHNANELSVENLLRDGQKLLAIRVYSDQNNCTLAEAHRATGIAQSNISKCCNNERNQAGGYKWSFVI